MKTKNIVWLVMAAALSLAALFHFKPWAGEPEPEKPIAIHSLRDLINIGNSRESLKKDYILETDLDLAGYNWKSIGKKKLIDDGLELEYGYSGTFDGNGHVISNLRQSDQECLGLFSKVEEGGMIKNLEIRDADLSYSGEGSVSGGVLARECAGFENVKVSGNVNLEADQVVFGGIAAILTSTPGGKADQGVSDVDIQIRLNDKETKDQKWNYAAGCFARSSIPVSNLTYNGNLQADNFSFGWVSGVGTLCFGASNLTNNGNVAVTSIGSSKDYINVAGVLNVVWAAPAINGQTSLTGIKSISYSSLTNNGEICHSWTPDSSRDNLIPKYSSGLVTGGVCSELYLRAVADDPGSAKPFETAVFDQFVNNGTISFQANSMHNPDYESESLALSTGGITGRLSVVTNLDLNHFRNIGTLQSNGSVSAWHTEDNKACTNTGLIAGQAMYGPDSMTLDEPILDLYGNFEYNSEAMVNGTSPEDCWCSGIIKGASTEEA